MTHGKHSAGRNKALVLILALALVVTAVIGGVVATLIANTDTVENSFTSASVSTLVNESFDGTTKTNVTVTNTGSTRAYIRAAIVVTWQDASGNVYGFAPVAGTDYVMTQTDTDWVLASDGFWYYTNPVLAGAETGNLIDRLVLVDNANVPEGYSLHVEILSSGIQSIPESTVTTHWSSGVSAIGENDVLTIKTA